VRAPGTGVAPRPGAPCSLGPAGPPGGGHQTGHQARRHGPGPRHDRAADRTGAPHDVPADRADDPRDADGLPPQGAALTEYALKLSRPTLAAGSVEVNAINYGMDDHDLTVAEEGSGAILTPVVGAGGEAALTLDLAPGTYRVYCSLLDGAHDAAGMHATLTVQ
jgi:plastocyanin